MHFKRVIIKLARLESLRALKLSKSGSKTVQSDNDIYIEINSVSSFSYKINSSHFNPPRFMCQATFHSQRELSQRQTENVNYQMSNPNQLKKKKKKHANAKPTILIMFISEY